MEDDVEQTLLHELAEHVAADRIDGRQIEERFRQHLATLVDDLHPSDAFDDEQTARPVAGIGDVDRVIEAIRHLDELNLRFTRKRPAYLSHLVNGLGDLPRADRQRKGAQHDC